LKILFPILKESTSGSLGLGGGLLGFSGGLLGFSGSLLGFGVQLKGNNIPFSRIRYTKYVHTKHLLEIHSVSFSRSSPLTS